MPFAGVKLLNRSLRKSKIGIFLLASTFVLPGHGQLVDSRNPKAREQQQRLLISQNPQDSFVNGILPRQLFLIANQTREFSRELTEAIVKRVEADKSNPRLQYVGVIDSGLDLVHPDLVGQLAYEVKDGKIVGAGKDVMAKDMLPSYVMVDPTLFAFGAEEIVNGLIKGPKESPIAFMKEINDYFTQDLMEKIRNEPKLKETYFSKLDANLLSLFKIDIAYQQWQKSDLIKQHVEKSIAAALVPGIFIKDNGSASSGIKTSVEGNWILSSEISGLKILDVLTRMPGFDIFHKMIEDSLAKTEAKYSFLKHKENLRRYILSHSASRNEEELNAKVMEYMLKTGKFIAAGYEAYNPIAVLSEMLGSVVGAPQLSTKEQIDKFIQEAQERVAYLEGNHDLDPQQKAMVAKLKKQIPFFKQALDKLKVALEDTTEGKKLRSQLRRNSVRNFHPYISSESGSNSHHTHVASTVAKQNENIRIYGIKVITQSAATPVQSQILVDQYRADIEKWLELPMIQELVKVIISEYKVPLKESRVKEELAKYIAGNSLGIIFMDEVLEAIKEVGRKKIKLTNISLGLTFMKSHVGQRRNQSIAEDIFSEYIRYKMGETIKKDAPKSLFFVATGNDSGWIDGQTKSAFPVGVYSERLDKISKEKQLPTAPNNSLDNIVAVASVNPKRKTLTGFTNIILDDRITQIASTGEEITAAIPRRDSSEHEQLVAKLFQQPLETINAVSDLVGKLNVDKGDAGKMQIHKQNTMFFSAWNFLGGLMGNGFVKVFHSKTAVETAEMSGTSMATPSATGKTADFVDKKAAELGVAASEVYDHAEFTPKVLLADLKTLATDKAIGGSFMKLSLLTEGIKTWKKSKGKVSIENELRAFKKSVRQEVYDLERSEVNSCQKVFKMK